MFIPVGKTAKLPKLSGARGFSKKERLKIPRTPRETKPPQPQTPYPFNSYWEYVHNQFLVSMDPRWIPQVQFGTIGYGWATRPDWLLPELKWAYYLDTPVHVYRGLRERDVNLRAQLVLLGYKVFEWYVPTLEYMVKHQRDWYRTNVQGKGYSP